MARYVFTLLFVLAMDGSPLDAQSTPKKIALIAGKPSHPVGMHEFNAGVQLLAKCLASTPNVQTEFVLNGWPRDEQVFDNASAVIFYMDGGGRHEVVQKHGRRLKLVDSWVKKESESASCITEWKWSQRKQVMSFRSG